MLAPITILVSPTMRCNLTCEGCYASEYSPDQDLDRGLLQRIVDEGNEMGVYLFTFLGGEPLLYPGLLDFARANRDSFFQIFTNGTLLHDHVVREMAETRERGSHVEHRRDPGVHRLATRRRRPRAGHEGYGQARKGRRPVRLFRDGDQQELG